VLLSWVEPEFGGRTPNEDLMATKLSPAQSLGTEILQTLQQRQASGDPPQPFRQTAEAARPGVSTSELLDALATSPLKGKVLLAFDEDVDSLAALKTDAAKLAADECLMETLVHRLCSQNFPLVTIDQCKALLTRSLQTSFKKVWTDRIASDQLPSFIKKVSSGKTAKGSLLDSRFRLPWETLSKGIIQALKRLRENGTGAYPASLAKILEETAPEATPEFIKQARESEPCRSQLATLLKKDDELVCLAEDRAKLLASDSFLQRLVHQTASAAVPVTTLKKLASRLSRTDQSLFLEQWGERIASGHVPDFLRLLPGKKTVKPETRELHDLRHPLAWETAANELLKQLRAARHQTGTAYPIAPNELLDRVLPDAPAVLREQAVACDLFRQHVQEIGAGNGRLVLLKEDGPRVAGKLVAPILSGLIKPDDQAIPLDKLVKGAPAELREAFAASLTAQLESGSLPEGTGALKIGKKWMLFWMSDIRGGIGRAAISPKAHVAPISTEASSGASRDKPSLPAQSDQFSRDFDQAFGKLDAETGRRNFVKLLDLRNALPQYDREEFERGLRQLRVERKFTLETSESLNTSVSEEERQAGIVEAGSRYLYCSRIR